MYLLLWSAMSSCVSYDSLVNYDQPPLSEGARQAIDNYRPLVIQPNDILHIRLSSPDEAAAQPFQLVGAGPGMNANNAVGMLLNGFLVNEQGEIAYPTIGRIKVGGLTMAAATEKLLTAVRPYFNEDPIIDIRLLNFTVNVNGEVSQPGSFTIPNERVTALEAIIRAGDLTGYADRDSVMVIREIGGERTFGYLDFNSPEVFASPYFYLQQNDVIYVRPLRRKVLTVQDPVRRALTYVSAATGVAAFIVAISRN